MSSNSSASFWKSSQTFPNCVLAETQLHLLEKGIWNSQRVFSPNFICIWLKLFQDTSKLCLTWNSIASCRKYTKTIWSCVWAEVQLRRVEFVLRNSHIASKPNFNCIWLNLIQDLSKKLHSWNSITFYVLFYFIQLHFACSMASYWIDSQTMPNWVLAEIRLHPIDNFPGQLPFVSQPKFNCIFWKKFQNFPNMCPSQNSIAYDPNFSKMGPNCCVDEIQ